ncbi:MAG: hypothetical protein GY696_30130, partial [Gammaproteobacteria bacterium]|nr:hypothetical protein [Gammaproteobacteria bacterium]
EKPSVTSRPRQISQEYANSLDCNYYSKYIRDYAVLTEPLLKRTRKNAQFSWDKECQTGFDELKKRIASPEVLVPFNPNNPTFLTTDASDVGLGAVLSQDCDGTDRPIAFASKTSKQNLQNRSRKKLLHARKGDSGMRLGYGALQSFPVWKKVHSQDRSNLPPNLANAIRRNSSSRRISRCYDRMPHYDYDVLHVKGTLNICADILSRLAAERKPCDSPALSDDDDGIVVVALTTQGRVTLEEVESGSKIDPSFWYPRSPSLISLHVSGKRRVSFAIAFRTENPIRLGYSESLSSFQGGGGSSSVPIGEEILDDFFSTKENVKKKFAKRSYWKERRSPKNPNLKGDFVRIR